MKLCLFLASLLFVSVYSIPVVKPAQTEAPTLSGKRVERFVDDIANSLTFEHQNALKLVASQNETVLSKKRRLDGLTLEFNHLRHRLSNITETFNSFNERRNSALNDYTTFMKRFNQFHEQIKKGKIEYDQEMKFLRDIKNYIKKMSLNCKT
jgi:polyhydroxyalkanoate synthesis regulator phasin